MIKKLGLYYRTIKHLKPIQIRYQLWYKLRDNIRKLTGHSYPISIPKKGNNVKLASSIQPQTSSFQLPKSFTFLNQSHSFENSINWNLKTHGKLWAYHLNYFNYLNQPEMSASRGRELMQSFIRQNENNATGMEPYPISLRGINWITFLSKHDIQDSEIDANLYAQYQVLLDNPEYHLLGNHLLENGISLLFGACYFRDEVLWNQAVEILNRELEEQVLEDGGHFERSTMYHSIILQRLLDCYNLLDNNTCFPDEGPLKKQIRQKSEQMLGWLQEMQWQDGDAPEVNDHVKEMLTDLPSLFDYADSLNLNPQPQTLSESGYRKYRGDRYELLVDAGDIGPDYQPGHAHSDIFSFLMRIKGQEIITDTGTSTYENNQRRQFERSTRAHNTVEVEGVEQNEVWSAFRVGRRGHVKMLKDQMHDIIALHDGYGFMEVIHERRFQFRDKSVTIGDRILSGRQKVNGIFYLHFPPGLEVTKLEDRVEGSLFSMHFNGYSKIMVGTYQKAVGYDMLEPAPMVAVAFRNTLETVIKVKEQL